VGIAWLGLMCSACGKSDTTANVSDDADAGGTGVAAGGTAGVAGGVSAPAASGTAGVAGVAESGNVAGEAGAAGSVVCPAGYGNCDGDPTNGCETDLTSDAAHCGACADACDDTNAEPHCSDGVCAVSCDEDFADCNDSADDGCETALASDADHCGWCGHDCGNATCSLGVCSPEVVATDEGSSSNQSRLVFDGTNFYWLTQPTMGSCRLLSTEQNGTTLQLHELPLAQCWMDSLAVDATNVYFSTRDQEIWRVAKAGDVASVIYTEQDGGYPSLLAVAGGNIFFAVAATGTLKRITTAGTGLEQVSIPGIDSLVLFNDLVYFSNIDQVASVDTALANQTMLMAINVNDVSTHIAVDESDVYRITTGGDGPLCYAVPPNNGFCVNSGESVATGLALASDAVYFTGFSGNVYRSERPPPGGDMPVLSDGGPCSAPGGPVLVEDHVYWVCGGSLLRTPR